MQFNIIYYTSTGTVPALPHISNMDELCKSGIKAFALSFIKYNMQTV